MKFMKLFTNKRITFFIIVSFIILSVLTASKLFISYYTTDKSAQIALAKQYIGIADEIAKELDKDIYQQFLLTKQNDENRERTKQYLEEYRYRINAVYVYILMLDESNISKTMVTALPSDVEDIPIGTACTVPPSQVRQAKNGLSYYTGIIEGEHNSSYLSVGVPFYSDNGNLLGVVGIDIDANTLEQVSYQTVKSNAFIFVIDILFAMALLSVVFVLNKWYKNRMKYDLKETEKMYISELSKAIDTIKSSRHDMMNHLQVLNGLMDLQMHDKTRDYLKRLTVESKTLNLSLRIKNPILMVLFHSKWELAQSKNIHIQFEADLNDYNRIESMDLVKIYANLLDNAIEASESYKGVHPKKIRVICKTIGSKYVFSVENPAELTVKEKNSLFQYGYTSQNNEDGLRGNGLTIISKTVEKYQGDIHVQYEEEKILIQINM